MSKKTFRDIEKIIDSFSSSDKKLISRAKNYMSRVICVPSESIELDAFFDFYACGIPDISYPSPTYLGKKSLEVIEKLHSLMEKTSNGGVSMTEQDYNNADGVRRSDLWKIKKSPAHFKYAVENPSEPTSAMLFGTAVHMAVLEPERFKNEYVVAEFDARTKEGKTLKQKYMDEGKTLLTKEQGKQIEGMAEAINKNQYAKRLLNGIHETSHFWEDSETGEICKCRTDCETDIGDMHYIVDLKTCANADTEEFTRDAVNFGYFMQAAMYTEGVRCTTEKDSVFVFVAVEKEPPYAVNVLQCGPDEIRLGMNGDKRGKNPGYRQLLNLYHECKVKDEWPGYEGFDNHINEIALPKWLKDDDE